MKQNYLQSICGRTTLSKSCYGQSREKLANILAD
jgi:hypothetical protein